MNITDTKLWKGLKKNKIFNTVYYKTVGRWIRKYRIKDRVKEMRKDGFNIVMELETALDNTSAVFFVDYGTLLGFVRDGGVIKWDFDIDFGIFINNDFSWEDLENALKEIGFYLHHQFRFHDQVTEQTYKRGNILVDFFNHFHEGDNTCSYAYYFRKDYDYQDKDIMHAAIFTTVKISGTKILEVPGGKVHIPIEAEQYLEELYTEKWRIPDPNFDGGSSPACYKYKDEIGCCEHIENKNSVEKTI